MLKLPDLRDVFVVDGSRTPFLKAAGSPGPFSASDLAVKAAQPLLLRQPFSPTLLDEVILGCVMPSPNEANIGRMVALRLGCGFNVPGWTVQRNCASGLQALDCAFINIATGRSDLVLAGGTESMSHGPLLYNEQMVFWLAKLYKCKTLAGRLKLLTRFRFSHLRPVIALLQGLTDPIVGLTMGQTAEKLAFRFKLTREIIDSYALLSHQRLANANDANFLSEIVPICDHLGKVTTADEGLRRDSSMARLAKLKPVFDRDCGMVTAGNSAQVTDGAAWLLLASEAAVKKHQLPVLGRIVDCTWAGLDPTQMGLGPAYAMAKLLQKTKLQAQQIDYWEINEAFAAQVLACIEAWKDESFCRQDLQHPGLIGAIDIERVNVDGGGISIGHPIGASGARIALHLLKVLERTGTHKGIASLCIGGGQGGAMLLERDTV